MEHIVWTFKKILTLEKDDNYFFELDKLVLKQKAAGVNDEELNLIYNFMKRLIVKNPSNRTLLIVNRIVNEMSDKNRERFIDIYSFFIANCDSVELKNEVRWIMEYQKAKIGKV